MASGDSDIGKIIEAAALAREKELRELRAQPRTLPPLSMIFVQSSEEVHGGFLAPNNLAKSLNLSTHDLAVTQIHRELRSGRIKALCEEVHVSVGNVIDRLKWVELDPWIWKLAAPSATADFWETGYFHIAIPATVGGSGSQGSFELFRVRFGWLRSRSEPGSEVDASQPGKATVGKADLAKWFDVFSSIHPDAVEDFALRSASAMFPDNHVPRQWVRDLRGPRKRGKPASRHE